MLKSISQHFPAIFKTQISELEKEIFWLGFDSDFKEVPWDKKYQNTQIRIKQS